MSVIVKLIIAVLVFVFAHWLLGLVGLNDPWALLVAVLVAVWTFLADPFARLR